MKYILFLLTVISIYSCSEEVIPEKIDAIQKEKTVEAIIDTKDLIKNDGYTYIDY